MKARKRERGRGKERKKERRKEGRAIKKGYRGSLKDRRMRRGLANIILSSTVL